MAAAWWGFGAFLFYKFATAVAFDHGLNLISCGLVGILAGAAVYVMGAGLATVYGQRRVKQLFADEDRGVMLQHMAVLVVLACVVVALLGWVVIVGFDARFADQVDMALFRYRPASAGLYTGHMWNLLGTMAMFALPVAVNGAWGIALYAVMARATRERP